MRIKSMVQAYQFLVYRLFAVIVPETQVVGIQQSSFAVVQHWPKVLWVTHVEFG